MNIRNIIKIHVLLLICLMVSSQFVFAAGIKERMKQRLPKIAELKKKGIIGEDNRGYLAFVSSVKAEQQLIADENKDRNKIYVHFAKQQNTTVDLVEKVQAKRKAERTKSGEFYQDPDGQWIKK